MAEERPSLPPPQVPIQGYTTPVNQEGFFSERVDYSRPEYRPIQRGTKYSTILGADQSVIDQFAELYFLRETREVGAHPWAMRFWATDTVAEDTYNSAVEYVSEAVSYPAYTRVYTVRRDSYEANTTLEIGTSLTSLIAIKVTDGGQDYTYATVTIDDSVGSDATTEAIIDQDGTIASIVITNVGSGYTSEPTVTITGDGGGALAIAIIQPQSAVLVSQKKTEFPDEKMSTGGAAYMHPLKNEYVIVTRVYETLPGPWVYSYKEDLDGELLTIKTRRNIGADIVTQEIITSDVWSDTTAKGVDDFVSEETNESRSVVTDDTEAGTASKMTTSRVDDDGKTVTVTRTQASAAYLASITTRETIVTGTWKRITSEPISSIKVWMIVETRVLPGNPIVEETIAKDGKRVAVVRTLKDVTTITPSESIIMGYWTKIETKSVSDLVAWELVTARLSLGNYIFSASIDGDQEVENIQTRLRDESDITPSSSESGGFITEVSKREVSDLVSDEITKVTRWLDKATYSVSIPESIIPLEFRAGITTTTTSHIIAGAASMPTLAAGEFEHSKRQLTKLLYEERITELGDVDLPIEQLGHETSTQFGGSVLDVIRTLSDSPLDAEEGEDVVASNVNPIGDDLMWFRETKKRPASDSEWPIVPSRLWDENMRVMYDETVQVVDEGSTEDPDPGGSTFAWLSEVKGVDKWRSRRININKPEPDYVDETSALVTFDYKPFKFPGLLYFILTGNPGGYVRRASAQLCRHTIRTWWVKSTTTPVITVDELFTDQIIINQLNNVTLLQYADDVLHDDIVAFGIFNYPATTPSYTDYVDNWIGVDKVIAASVTPEREKDIWKCQTRSVVMK